MPKTSCLQVVGSQSRVHEDGGFLGPFIDETQFCRYRFTPGEERLGAASVCHGLAYTSDSLESEKLVVSSAGSAVCTAAPERTASIDLHRLSGAHQFCFYMLKTTRLHNTPPSCGLSSATCLAQLVADSRLVAC